MVYDAGSTTVRVNSTYTGTTTVQNGSVFISVPDALGATLGTPANRVIANPGGEVYLNGASFAVGNKLLTLNGGALVGNSNAKSWAGAITQTAPSIVGAEGINGTLTLTGGIDNGGHLLTLRANFDTSTINVNTVGLSGSGGLAVIAPTSSGLVNLNATGTYAGATTVTNARLYANATHATGTGTVTVSPGGRRHPRRHRVGGRGRGDQRRRHPGPGRGLGPRHADGGQPGDDGVRDRVPRPADRSGGGQPGQAGRDRRGVLVRRGQPEPGHHRADRDDPASGRSST